MPDSSWLRSPHVVLRADLDPSRLAPSIRDAVRAVDPHLPLRGEATMNERLGRSLLEPRLRSLVFALIGGLALALAVTGIYGVTALQEAQRRRETAIRRALGAGRGRVVGTVLATGVGLTASGVTIGLAGAWLTTRTLGALLFQVDPRDPAVLGTVVALLAASALIACAVPVLRAVRVDPAAALRDE